MGKADRRRQAAQLVREQKVREQRRKRLLLSLGVGALVLAIGALAWVVIDRSQGADVVDPPSANAEFGFKFGEGPVTADIYIDYMCPACNQFETTNQELIQQAIDSGLASVTYHPVAILNRYSNGTEYSTRAGAASACAADEGKYLEYTGVLFQNQPAENSEGLGDDELINLGQTIGLADAFADCVTSGKYKPWMDAATDDASEEGLSGTPWVKVNEEPLENSGDFGTKFPEALNAAASTVSESPSAGASSGS